MSTANPMTAHASLQLNLQEKCGELDAALARGDILERLLQKRYLPLNLNSGLTACTRSPHARGP